MRFGPDRPGLAARSAGPRAPAPARGPRGASSLLRRAKAGQTRSPENPLSKTARSVSAATGVGVLTAQAFRRAVMRPADGVFLFHARALERLAGIERGECRLLGSAEIQYVLIPRGRFLRALESENPEALAVIEGLPLPDPVLLLPMPTDAVLRPSAERSAERPLLRDYWARRCEGEVARAWQVSRDDNQDRDRFGAAALAALIGDTALTEARDVLLRDGVPGAGAGLETLCAAFAARVVRLRYFGPGVRGCYFPAVTDWGTVDRWLEAGGLDLPAPLAGRRPPLLVERSRPRLACSPPAFLAPLPPGSPCGLADPDLTARRAETEVRLPHPVPRPGPVPGGAPEPEGTPGGPAATAWQARCLDAVREGSAVRRRRGLAARAGAAFFGLALPVLRGVLVLAPALARMRRGQSADHRPRIAGQELRIALLRFSIAVAQRAEWAGRYADALVHLAEARAVCLAGAGTESAGELVLHLIDERARAAGESLGDLLAASSKLGRTDATILKELITRLTAVRASRARKGPRRTVRLLLGQLQAILLEGRATYYRPSLRDWLRRGRSRRFLPFRGPLKALRALDGARDLLDELPWPATDLDRFAVALDALSARIGERLEGQLGPRIREALEQSGLAEDADDSAGPLGVRRLQDALTDLIRRRRYLRFADVRDLLARDVWSLPDSRLPELWQGDRLSRFDRAAALALPGVYHRGEPYVKGLQRLGAPLFGTAFGRGLLAVALLPAIAAWALLKSSEMLWVLLAPGPGQPELVTPAAILGLGLILSLGANTAPGRRLAMGLWQGVKALARLPVGAMLRRLVARLSRWGPVAWLGSRRLVRGLWERLLAPVGLGLVGIFPIALPLSFALSTPAVTPFWVAALALAFALGTLLRDTPNGRRRMDDLAGTWHQLLVALRRERLEDLIAPIMDFFNARMRELGDALNRVRTRLSLRLEDPPDAVLLKTLLGPLWGALEAVVRFYAVVLIEPQTNPVKHFPVVTLGHKLMLPFLPALSSGLLAVLSPVLPAVLAVPLVALTIFLLPGLFGFLFWELKENRRLYAANRPDGAPPAILGTHGETLHGLLRRGFHSGALPKSFDRLRGVLADQVRDERPDPLVLRQVLGRLNRLRADLVRFAEQELALPLEARCGTGPGGLAVSRVRAEMATRGVVFVLALTPADSPDSPLDLRVSVWLAETGLAAQVQGLDAAARLGDERRRSLAETIVGFLGRCGLSPSPAELLVAEGATRANPAAEAAA